MWQHKGLRVQYVEVLHPRGRLHLQHNRFANIETVSCKVFTVFFMMSASDTIGLKCIHYVHRVNKIPHSVLPDSGNKRIFKVPVKYTAGKISE